MCTLLEWKLDITNHNLVTKAVSNDDIVISKVLQYDNLKSFHQLMALTKNIEESSQITFH